MGRRPSERLSGILPGRREGNDTRDLPLERARREPAQKRWKRASRYNRRAQLTAREVLTLTGTIRLAFRVIDDQPFAFEPGQFIGIQADIPDVGLRRTPYCMITAPNPERTFQLLVRVVPEGPMSQVLDALEPGDVIPFRGPIGRSMVPKDTDRELVLLATGVGIGPFLGLVHHLQAQGRRQPARLYWGLRLPEDICLLDELDDLVARTDLVYHISLSQPPPDWHDLCGRVTESVPPLLQTLGGKRFSLCGNGAMIEEMAAALSDLGVSEKQVHKEAYFNRRYRPDLDTIAAVRSRFTADDLAAPFRLWESANTQTKRAFSAR